MSTVIISDSMVISVSPGAAEVAVNTKASSQVEVDFAKCSCCGLTEECTLSYIETVRERYGGKWICGLCAEAVKDEILRCQKVIGLDEAMARHLSFCNKFRSSDPPAVHVIQAMSQVLRRSLESPKSMTRSLPSSPTRTVSDLNSNLLARSGSCMPSLALVESSMYCGIEDVCDFQEMDHGT